MSSNSDYTSPTPGTHGRLFAEPTPSPDPTSFQVDNTSSNYYQSAYYLAHKTQVQMIPAPTVSQPRMDLAGDALKTCLRCNPRHFKHFEFRASFRTVGGRIGKKMKKALQTSGAGRKSRKGPRRSWARSQMGNPGLNQSKPKEAQDDIHPYFDCRA